MAEIKKVDELPIVEEADFPELPDKFDGERYVVFGSKWHHGEEELTLALIMTAVARHGKWEAIPWDEIVELIKSDMMSRATLGSCAGYYLHKVADSGDISIIQFNENFFIVPEPTMADTIKACTIRCYDEIPERVLPASKPPIRMKPTIFESLIQWLTSPD